MSTGERIFVVIAVLAAIVWVAVVWFALTTPPIRSPSFEASVSPQADTSSRNPADDYEVLDSSRRVVGRIMPSHHTRSLAGFIIISFGFRFSVHTGIA
jgi:hypothetical protein